MKILLVEDEPKIARAVRMGFEQERAVVEVIDNGPAALAAARMETYDVMIFDRMLPGGMDGAEICQTLRKEGIMTPVILLTARGQIKDRVEGLTIGADDYMTKPFSFDELLARTRALMRRPAQLASEVLRVGDLTLDPVSVKVERAGVVIELTQTEFALCEYMMRNHGRVLSKEMMMSNVWDFDADVLPNTVEAFVGYLRSKIDKPFKNSPKLIHTVRGFGYKMEDISA